MIEKQCLTPLLGCFQHGGRQSNPARAHHLFNDLAKFYTGVACSIEHAAIFKTPKPAPV